MKRAADWSEKELQILRDYYPTSTKDEIRALLVFRSYDSIKTKATKLKVKRLFKQEPRKKEIGHKKVLDTGTLYINGNVMVHRMG